MADEQRVIRFSDYCRSPAEVVYDVLADLRTHLEWAGTGEDDSFGLKTLDAPEGPATLGTTFATTGNIPMSGTEWDDHSEVTEAEPPSVFAFVTKAGAQLSASKRMRTTYEHRYEISPHGDGSFIVYTAKQIEISDPMKRMSLPIVSNITWGVMIPIALKTGFDNLIRYAANRTSANPVVH